VPFEDLSDADKESFLKLEEEAAGIRSELDKLVLVIAAARRAWVSNRSDKLAEKAMVQAEEQARQR
jgi:hypothetical protein